MAAQRRPWDIVGRAEELRPTGGDAVTVKRFVLLPLLAIILAAFLAGCASGPAGPVGTASEIVDKIFEEAGVQRFGDAQSVDTDEGMEFFLGSADYPPFADLAVVQPMISI
ncbi:MAG: hypothetical protein HQ548_03525, partial [Chloroflexi bacterium]|nr:hypothetical protein [Chloroflexota bacterium]